MQLRLLDAVAGTGAAAATFGVKLRQLREAEVKLREADALQDEAERSRQQSLVQQVGPPLLFPLLSCPSPPLHGPSACETSWATGPKGAGCGGGNCSTVRVAAVLFPKPPFLALFSPRLLRRRGSLYETSMMKQKEKREGADARMLAQCPGRPSPAFAFQ